jgi:5'-methylthioadenosine phosphorylase
VDAPPGPSGAPRATGDRLGLVVGSGMTGSTFAVTAHTIDRTVPGADGDDRFVLLEDCGGFVLLRRHASTGETVPAHRVDHHANIRALAEAGCSHILALSSVGSLRPDWGVGTVVVPDDFLAFDAYPSFYDDVRGHGVPGFDPAWRATVLEAWQQAAASGGAVAHDGGVYAQTRGPRFETPAEVRMLAQHAHLVGMTVAHEAILAREAGLAYAAVCKVDNLGNGLDVDLLTVEDYHDNTAATLDDFVAVVAAVLEILGATR